MSLKRLNKEFAKLQSQDTDEYSVMLENEDLFTWTLMLMGPAESPYSGGLFHVQLQFGADYPFKAPTVRFKTKIYHPNIKSTGEICADAITDSWGPTRNVEYVIKVLQNLLRDPNADNPLEAEIGKQFQEDRKGFDATARKWTEEYAQ
mmetsp:Transcript_14277/g.45630  ORF Transcript_14277/g.45630 Transcript_14277/m.45630 type:complete len:148 (+) Transcript_14277:37-480(+)|eukprot:CAMPEP_0196780062 /NCGR_PEP_ID=MMETSP1104-20130614/6945_1 /TAXON_ID=33652 /ORGANISM="Cafeteria sp., Strain Caron Lab Isolate" /LENGTH=147 /DNA_ID=CAMNT_0042150251 /DNA_START=10 /DNA_END=453 /DNA_ORIENTATION=+